MSKSYYCKKAETTLHFLPDKIKYCCTCAEGPGVAIDDFDNLDIKKIETARNKILTALSKGKIPLECNGCNEYSEKDKPVLFEKIFGVKNNKKINHIIINHFKQCDCACIYCSQKLIYPTEHKIYKILPLINKLYKNNLISDDVNVEFQGGSVGVWSEYEETLKELSKRNCRNFNILTNGIKYEPMIEEISKNATVNICISLDCGSRDKFFEIKKVDKFETVIDNISKYRKTNANLTLKYILLNNINDSREEIKNFLDIAKTFNCIVNLDLDYREVYFGNFDKYVLPEKYIQITNFAEKYAKDNNIELYLNNALKLKLNAAENINSLSAG